MFLHDESAVNTEKNGCVLEEYVKEVVGRRGGWLVVVVVVAAAGVVAVVVVVVVLLLLVVVAAVVVVIAVAVVVCNSCRVRKCSSQSTGQRHRSSTEKRPPCTHIHLGV